MVCAWCIALIAVCAMALVVKVTNAQPGERRANSSSIHLMIYLTDIYWTPTTCPSAMLPIQTWFLPSGVHDLVGKVMCYHQAIHASGRNQGSTNRRESAWQIKEESHSLVSLVKGVFALGHRISPKTETENFNARHLSAECRFLGGTGINWQESQRDLETQHHTQPSPSWQYHSRQLEITGFHWSN